MTIGGVYFGILDIIFLAILLVCAIHGAVKGFVDEVLSKAAVILGAIVAIAFYRVLAPVLAAKFNIRFLAAVVAFLVLFLATYILVKIVQMVVGSAFRASPLAGLNQALGLFLGLVEAFIIILVMLFVLKIQPVFDVSALLEDSFIAQVLLPFVVSSGVQRLLREGAALV